MTPTPMELLEREIRACRRCRLCEQRSQAVPGEGSPTSPILFVGEGPGAEEDKQGRPFVGPAGQLLDRMLNAAGLSRGEVFIANVVKCRPPFNREPTPEEAAECLGYLRRQFKIIRPKVIVCLGGTAGKALIEDKYRVTSGRGKWIERAGVWMIGTYHPSALLRNPALKRDAWADMQEIVRKLSELT